MATPRDSQFIVDKENLVVRVGKLGSLFGREKRGGRLNPRPWNDPVRVERRKKILNTLLVVLAVVVFSAVLAMCVGSKVGVL